ncbi:hypothetical protein FMM05_08160 [Flavobacterium zepuense]|uniref:Lipoprotein n=1 Tax=Flavobacterium zepuense TaxID=2593302 RepID=A0A552V4A7_9FLAO|nr:hypothetical protein [Flavobacterium zepuense]TRW25269.1 hypothetical protein FMM05_08160 [Flavobacterium zepuense]
MKKNFTYIILSCIVILTLATSCSHEGHDESPADMFVQYRINVEEPIIESVQYRTPEGELVHVSHSLTDLEQWYTSVEVDAPFDAFKEVRFVNNGTEEVPYTLSIFVEGELAHTKQGLVMPQEQKVDRIEHSVLD